MRFTTITLVTLGLLSAHVVLASAVSDPSATLRALGSSTLHPASEEQKNKRQGIPDGDSEGARLGLGLHRATLDLQSRAEPDELKSSEFRADGAVRVYRQRADSVTVIVTETGSFGSGVLVLDSHFVLTNWHVVGETRQVGVAFRSDNQAPAEEPQFHQATVVALLPEKDLALLRLSGTAPEVSAVPLAKLEEVEVGSDVYAIGHPEGMIWTLTHGIVSQIRADFEWNYSDGSLLQATVVQTQTSVNPGSSGGPLFNSAGQLVGLNTFSASGEGLHFAVAASEVENFLANRWKFTPEKAVIRRADPQNQDPQLVGESDLNKDGVIDTWAFDTDGDGRPDIWVSDFDGDDSPDAYSLDVNRDGVAETVAFDDDLDGVFDRYFFDSDSDGSIDTYGLDSDGDGSIDRYGPYSG